ncbi:hypothetical protein AZL_a02020 (plasmid) [Azospirillum sp. B510]|uniref:hypothetical protein n=1 Tax=Azospirillum sp. (strain B510) TaxID=137722 RepID=UPI0001C4B998|nr:hypothetical protein [Azospirillum sp. B510]BAI73733.1 hypothetical protein AZL_a02020 [Azospirillum sp. B510]
MFAPGSARTTCIALSICGVLFAGIGAALHIRSYLLGAAVAEGGSRSDAACLGAARRMGGELTVTPDGLRLVVPEAVDQRTSLTDASGLMAFCPDMTLSYFCMGLSCAPGGKVSMQVELVRRSL